MGRYYKTEIEKKDKNRKKKIKKTIDQQRDRSNKTKNKKRRKNGAQADRQNAHHKTKHIRQPPLGSR